MTKRSRSVIAAATSAGMPGFIKPQLATLKAKVPAGKDRIGNEQDESSTKRAALPGQAG